MPSAVKLARIAVSFMLGFVVFSTRGWGQQEVLNAAKDGSGYWLTNKTDDKVKAPAGYVGDTDKSTQTYTGYTPPTAGKVFVMKMTMGNQIKICPKADGTSEGEGEFTFSLRYSDEQGNVGQMTMDTKAKYKGKVGDDAMLDGPVKADFDYSFSQSGSFPDQNGVIFSPVARNVVQHVSMDVTVASGMGMPTLGNIVESALPQDAVSNAFLAAAGVAIFGGYYYSVAETMWTQGTCVQVAFDPPSHTVNPPPGTQVKVKVQVKSKDGEITKAQLGNVRAHAGSDVSPGGGLSNVGTPMTFTYTAPTEKPTGESKPGFEVDVLSRAGATSMRNPGDWEAGLGKDWSGTMSCRLETWGDQAANPPFGYVSNSSVGQITINVVDGVGTLIGYGEAKSESESRQGVWDGTTKLISRDSGQGSASGVLPAKIQIDIDKESGKYSVSWDAASMIIGKAHWVQCGPDGCKGGDRDFPVNAGGCRGSGDLSDPNHVQGSWSDLKSNVGSTGKGKLLETIDWNFVRQGATK